MCRCDVKGFVGHDATNSKAACAKSDAKDPIVALTETVKVLTERITALTDTNARLEATVKGIQDNVADVGAATIKLSEQKAVVDGQYMSTHKAMWRNSWIRDVFCYRIPAPLVPGTNGAGGVPTRKVSNPA